MEPTKLAADTDNRPTRILLAEAITAMKNKTTTPVNAWHQHELKNTLTQTEARIVARIDAATSTINAHTNLRLEASRSKIINHATLVQKQVNQLSLTFKDFASTLVGFTTRLDDQMKNLAAPPEIAQLANNMQANDE